MDYDDQVLVNRAWAEQATVNVVELYGEWLVLCSRLPPPRSSRAAEDAAPLVY